MLNTEFSYLFVFGDIIENGKIHEGQKGNEE